jgi:NADH-quinone oxidoreductase subunit G
MLRVEGQWREASWEEALQAAARGLKAAGENLGTLVHPSCTVEEAHLAARVTRSLGSANIDHRLRVRDFRDASADPLHPTLGLPIAEVDALTGVLVVGGNLRAEMPLLAHRLRKAVVRGKARVAFIEAEPAPYHFPVASRVGAAPAAWVHELAAIVKAAAELAGSSPGPLFADLLHGVVVSDAHRSAAAALCHGTQRIVWLGAMALRHPSSVDLRALGAELARVSGARLGLLAEGGNAAGLWLAGCVPHREAGGRAATAVGHSVQAMLEHPQRAYLLVGAMEPEADFADATLAEVALNQAACVVALTPFASESIKRVAHVLLPMAAFAETSGSYVNLEGRLQSHAAATAAPGEARPGWKILRVLANVLGLEGFAQQSSEDVRAELQQLIDAAAGAGAPEALVSTHVPAMAAVSASADLDLGTLDVPMYSIDAVLRRSPALQQTSIAERSRTAGGQG